MAKADRPQLPPDLIDRVSGPKPPPPRPPAAARPDTPADPDKPEELDPRVFDTSPQATAHLAPAARAAAQALRGRIRPLGNPLGSPLVDDGVPLGDDDTLAAPAAAPGAPTSPQPPAATLPPAADPPPVSDAPPPAGESLTSEGDAIRLCPNCSFDQSRSDVPEVSEDDKVNFLIHLQGMDFVKSYPILGGNLTATFRRLTVAELDAITAHVNQLVFNQVILPVGLDYNEAFIRYRTYLQLVGLTGKTGIPAPLAMGLSPSTNPEASSHYQGEDGQEASVADVATYVTTKIIRNESLYRMLAKALEQFNRLVMHLEANAANPSFWPRVP